LKLFSRRLENGPLTIVAAGWTDDDCNADEGLTTPTSLTVSNVESSYFSVTIYDGEIRIGEGSSTCTHEADDVYNCEELTHGFSYTDMDASISMAGEFTVSVNSETTVSGSGVLLFQCSGADCDELATQTNSGSFPCATTLNWSAEAN